MRVRNAWGAAAGGQGGLEGRTPRTQASRGTPAAQALWALPLSLSSDPPGLLQGLSGWLCHSVPQFPCLSKVDRTAPTS